MNDYYGALYNRNSPSPAIGYGEWINSFNEEQFERVKKMTEEEVKDICGVNPNLLSPDYKFEKELSESMKDWGEQTYAKDEGYTPFNLEELQKLWKDIIKEKRLKKERKMSILILKDRHTKKKRQYIVSSDEYKVGDILLLDNRDWKVIKVIDRGKKLQGTEHKRVTINDCKPKGAVFSEFAMHLKNWEIPEYMKGLLKGLEKPNMVLSYHRQAGRNTAYEIIKKEEARRKLSEFHKRPYLNVVVEEVKGKPQGKENLEKIEFPCYCSYVNGGKIYSGELNHSRYYGLFRIDKQDKYNFVDEMSSLNHLMEVYKIQIVKAEVKLWREVGEYTKKKE